jgi:hypothetical protein
MSVNSLSYRCRRLTPQQRIRCGTAGEEFAVLLPGLSAVDAFAKQSITPRKKERKKEWIASSLRSSQ